MEFAYKALPWNVLFGAGYLARLPKELDKLSLKKALVLTTPNQAEAGERIVTLLGARAVGLFDRAVMHVPTATADAATTTASERGADCTVALGGGSTTGLGKALAAKIGLPNIVIPTSYAGSEMTNIWALTDQGRKTTFRDDKVVPTLTLYDPELTLTLPPKFAGASGLNAIAQAAVNVATDKPNPIISTMAAEAVRALYQSLPVIMRDPDNIEARSEALYGACLAGAALGAGETSLHHKLCHTFGGAFDTPHAETHAILLPHSIAYNAAATKAGTTKLAAAMNTENAPQAIFNLLQTIGGPTALKDIGVKEDDLDRAAQMTLEKPFHNAEPVTAPRLRQLLQNAYEGRPPQAIA